MASEQFEWITSQDGNTVQRNLDEAETFYASISQLYKPIQKTAFGLTAHASISLLHDGSQDLESRLSNAMADAWTLIFKQHPVLISEVKCDLKTRFLRRICKLKPDEAVLKHHAMRVIDEGVSGVAFHNLDPPFDDPAAFYLVIPAVGQDHDVVLRRDLVLRIEHDRIDGMGALMLLDKLISNTADILDGKLRQEEPPNPVMSPSLRKAADIPTRPTPDQIAKLEAARRMNAEAQENTNVKLLNIRFNETATEPGRSLRSSIILSIERSEKITAACKTLKSTPTAVFHAGIALALGEEEEMKHGIARYLSYALINLRSVCKVPGKASEHFASIYHCISTNSLVIDIPSSMAVENSSLEVEKQIVQHKRFVTAVEQSTTFYKGLKLDADYLSIVPELFQAKTPQYEPVSSSIPQPNGSPSISLSSMGVVDRTIQSRYGNISVRNFWVAGAEYSTGIGCFLSKFNGEIEFSAVWNVAFHTEDRIEKLLHKVLDIVETGLLKADEDQG